MPVSNCTKKNKQNRHQILIERRKECGLCYRCGARPPKDGPICELCRDVANKRKKAYRENNKKLGLCADCVKQREKTTCGVRYCNNCSDVRKTARRRQWDRRRKKGLCVRCCEVAETGSALCKACSDNKSVESRKNRLCENRTRRTKHLKLVKNYGLTIDDYEQLLAEQNYSCEICQRPHNQESKRVLFVDHDHKTGKLRGLLCNNCNTVLGLVYESPEILRQAANYVEKYKQKN